MAVNNKAWDIGFRREIGDESNPTWAIVIGGTSNALHIVDPLNAGTDYNVAADATPTLYIHGSANAVTEYIRVYTDQTDAHFNVVGANLDVDVPTGGSVSIQVNNTDEFEFSATNLNMNSNTLGSVGAATFLSTVNFSNGAISSAGTTTFLGQINAGSQIVNGAGNLVFVTGRTIAGTNLVIDATGTAVRMNAAASWAATGTGTIGSTALLGPAEIGSVSLKSWFKLLDAAGTTVYWIQAFAP